jgi:hypothetical protein
LAEIKKLHSRGSVDDLTQALIKIDHLELKYPSYYETARFIRGEVASTLHEKEGGEDLNYANHMRNYHP